MRAILCILLLAAPAYSQTLLAELRNTNSSGGLIGTMPNKLEFRFSADGTAQWVDYASQSGEVFTAPQQVVDSVRAPISGSWFGACLGTNDLCITGSLEFWTGGVGLTAKYSFDGFVPDLRDYYLTGLTRTIDAVSIQQFGSRWSYEGTQTIRFYGEFAGPQPGDFNQNFVVDAADYVLWRNRFTPPLGGDGQLPNESGQSDDWIAHEDYQFWRAQFGHSSIPSGSALLAGGSVPEPSSWLLFFFLLLSLGNSARR